MTNYTSKKILTLILITFCSCFNASSQPKHTTNSGIIGQVSLHSDPNYFIFQSNWPGTLSFLSITPKKLLSSDHTFKQLSRVKTQSKKMQNLVHYLANSNNSSEIHDFINNHPIAIFYYTATNPKVEALALVDPKKGGGSLFIESKSSITTRIYEDYFLQDFCKRLFEIRSQLRDYTESTENSSVLRTLEQAALNNLQQEINSTLLDLAEQQTPIPPLPKNDKNPSKNLVSFFKSLLYPKAEQ